MRFFLSLRVRRALPAVLPLLLGALAARAQPTARPAEEPRLEITGQLKITGGAPGAGKVLTSDAAGLGRWTVPLTTTLVCTGKLPAQAGHDVLLALPAAVEPAAIVGVTAVVPLAGGEIIPPGYTAISDRYYNVSVQDGRVRLFTTTHSAAVLGQPVRVLLTYQTLPPDPVPTE